MSEPMRVLLVGATGLIGRAVKREMVGRSEFSLVALARREVRLPEGARMEMVLAEPADWDQAIARMKPHAVVSALGTTWRKAGRNEESFRAVDEKLVLDVAAAAKAAGAQHFIAISSVGANPGSKTFYLRVKGEVERSLMKMKFRRLDILRPGLLRGKRQADRRFSERMGILLSPLTDVILQGGARQYRSIADSTMAQGIVSLLKEKAQGRFVHDNDMIARAARRLDG